MSEADIAEVPTNPLGVNNCSLFVPNSTQTFEGERNAAGARHGAGKNKYLNNDSYDGLYADGLRHGKGTYVFAVQSQNEEEKDEEEDFEDTETPKDTAVSAKACYVGEYQSGRRHGQGQLWFPDSTRYKGEFQSGLIQGQGTYFYANGDTYVGAWEQGKRTGQGTYTAAQSKSSASGQWVNGELKSNIVIKHADCSVSVEKLNESNAVISFANGHKQKIVPPTINFLSVAVVV